MDNSKTLCTICARGGSKGVKDKNIRLINNVPLIAHTIAQAIDSQLFDDVVVSTDDERIQEAALAAGAKILFTRPKELAGDKSAKIPVIRHALLETEKILGKSYDYLCDLDATSPLRSIQDIKECMNLVFTDKVSNVITAAPARRSPYFNLIELNENNSPVLSKPSDVSRRQDSRKCFDMNASIYVWTRKTLIENDTLFLANTSLYVMPESRSLDIDTELDFRIVSALMENKI